MVVGVRRGRPGRLLSPAAGGADDASQSGMARFSGRVIVKLRNHHPPPFYFGTRSRSPAARTTHYRGRPRGYQFAASQLRATLALIFSPSTAAAGTTMPCHPDGLRRRCECIAICSWQIRPSETLVHGPMPSGMSPLIAPLAFSAFRPTNHAVQDALHRRLPYQSRVIHNRTRVRCRVYECFQASHKAVTIDRGCYARPISAGC